LPGRAVRAAAQRRKCAWQARKAALRVAACRHCSIVLGVGMYEGTRMDLGMMIQVRVIGRFHLSPIAQELTVWRKGPAPGLLNLTSH